MELQEIKQRLSINTVLAHYGIKADKNNMAHCPFHDDKTPSLQIYPKSSTYCCFSSNCSAGTGDQIQFIELMENKGASTKQSKHQAIEKAKSMLGINGQTSKEKPPKPQQNVKTESLTDIFQKLQQNIGKSPKAKQYIRDRSLDIERLEIGYNANGYDQLKNCIVFPLKCKSGEVVSLYGRSVKDNGNSRHFYTKNRKGLYPGYPARETKSLILTESVIDAATLLSDPAITKQYEVLALYGTNGLTAEHIHAIQQLSELKELILFFDGDEAGKAANEKHGKYLQEMFPDVKISVVETIENEDINSQVQSHELEILSHLIEDRKLFFLSTEKKSGGLVMPSEENEMQENPALPPSFNVTNPDYITYRKGNLKFTLLGGISLQQIDRLRVTLKLNIEPQLSALQSIRHNIDLYNDDQVEKFCRKAAEKLEIGTTQILQSISELIEELEQYRLNKIESRKDIKPKQRTLTPERKQAAINYLKSPKLLKRTNADIAKTGVIGEEVNRLLMYLVFTSRLREHPLHIISLGASGTGKTYLQEKIAELIPDQDKVEITVLSDNAFYYFGRTELANKLILIEDMDGAENVLLPLRELMSKKKISKQVVVKNSKGNMGTIKVQVEGPICVAGTTTRERIYEDNANRSLLIYLDGSKQHQEQIMDYQRALSAGEIDSQGESQIKEQFQDMQSLLKPIAVRNPYAKQLKIPQEVFKPLRTNSHYLQCIECVTFYHQYQRESKLDRQTNERYIETTLEDISATNALMKDVLLAKSDELSGACRNFFEALKSHLTRQDKQSFYAKEIRSALRLSYATLKRHLFQLATNGYIKVVGGDKFRKGYEYEVVSFEEYRELQGNIKNALDAALERINGKKD